MTGVKIDTNAIIDGATTDGAIAAATTTTVATTAMRCRADTMAAPVDGPAIFVRATIKPFTQAIQPPPPTCYRNCIGQSAPAAEPTTATTAGTATTKVSEPEPANSLT